MSDHAAAPIRSVLPAVDTLVLGTPGPEKVRRPRRWPTALLVGAVLVLAVTWTVDRWQQGREFNAVLQRAAVAQADSAQAEAHVGSMLAYVAPGRYEPDTSGAIRADLEQLVAVAATDAAATLRTEASAMSAVPVSGWHTALLAARAAYVRQLLARADAYDALRRRDPVLPGTPEHTDLMSVLPVREAFDAAATSPAGRASADALFAR